MFVVSLLLAVHAQAQTKYCPSAKDLTVSYGNTNTQPTLKDQGWSISGGGGVATLAAYNLLGGYVEYDVTFSGVPTGVNANIYSISPTGIPSTGFNASNNYCDGQGGAGGASYPFCVELDWIESNGNCGGATTLHDVEGTGQSQNCNGWGCGTDYTYDDGANFNMRIEFTTDGVMTAYRNGVELGPYYPTPQQLDWDNIKAAYTTGAVIYSSQWVGWVPTIGDCPTNNGNLDAAYMEISNLVVAGTVTQGPTPAACSSLEEK